MSNPTERPFTIPHYAAIVSTIALVLSGGSLLFTKRSYDLTAMKEQREVLEKKPEIDIQLTPNGRVKSTDFTIYLYNRGDTNIVPDDVTALHLLQQGDLYLSSPKQSVDKLSAHLSLSSMGVVPPKGTATMKATVSGVTDGKDDWPDGADIIFVVRIRVGGPTETVETVTISRGVNSRLRERNGF